MLYFTALAAVTYFRVIGYVELHSSGKAMANDTSRWADHAILDRCLWYYGDYTDLKLITNSCGLLLVWLIIHSRSSHKSGVLQAASSGILRLSHWYSVGHCGNPNTPYIFSEQNKSLDVSRVLRTSLLWRIRLKDDIHSQCNVRCAVSPIFLHFFGL